MNNVTKANNGALATVNFEADAGQGLNMGQKILLYHF